MIPQLLAFHSPRDKLRALQINALQLTKVLKANGHNSDSNWELDEGYRLHRRWIEVIKTEKQDERTMDIQADQVVKQYMKALKAMSSDITASISCYDLHAMVSGIAVLVQVFGWLVCRELCRSESPSKISWIEDVIPSASSFFAIGACFMVAVGVHMSICSSTLVSGKSLSTIISMCT